jgi:4-carboxymuconolactone decarboxylase
MHELLVREAPGLHRHRRGELRELVKGTGEATRQAMARIPMIEQKADLAPEGQAVWDLIAESRGRVVGPFSLLLHSPPLAERTAHLGAYIRFESALSPADRELAILAVARELDCEFEWAYHVPVARKAGAREEAIAALRDRRVAGLTTQEAQLVGYVGQLLRTHRVDEKTFGAMRERFGERGLVELTATVGYYGMLASLLNAFEVTPAPGDDLLPL